jgi:hypothetical protein
VFPVRYELNVEMLRRWILSPREAKALTSAHSMHSDLRDEVV